jgi:hypothetical protein
MRDTSY